jgi:hypothetical protein
MNLHFGTKYNVPFSRNTSSKNIQMGNFSKIAKIINQSKVNNIPVQPIVQSTEQSIEQPKKMKWGEPTWFLLHTLCEKVHETDFPQIRQSLINIIYSICTNLPCPDCSAHAKQYLDGINFNAIQTKEQLKRVFFDFHNSLNVKKGFPIFNYQDLQKYSTAITINIIYNFMNFYSVKNHSIHMISNDIYRNRMIDTIKTWFNVNIKYFDK